MRQGKVLASLIALGLLMSACGGGQTAGSSAAAGSGVASGGKPAASGAAATNDQLYEAAKKEGEIVANVQDSDSERLAVDTFTKRYPGIKITWQLGRGADVANKLTTQAQGNVFTHDVFSSGPHDMDGMREAGMLEPYQSPELANVRPDFVDANKVIDPQYVLVYGITVNTKLVPPDQEPKSWNDLLDPKWKGKIAMQDPRGSGGTMTLLVGLSKYEPLGMDYIRKLAAQQPFIGRETNQLLTQLVSGEFPIMLGVSAGQLVTQKDKNPSVPVKEIKPTEGIPMVLLGAGLMKNAPHPNAARLWLDWRLSQEGQEVLGKEGQSPVRNGVPTPHEETTIEGVKLLYLDKGQDTANLPQYTKQWDDIFFKK